MVSFERRHAAVKSFREHLGRLERMISTVDTLLEGAETRCLTPAVEGHCLPDALNAADKIKAIPSLESDECLSVAAELKCLLTTIEATSDDTIDAPPKAFEIEDFDWDSAAEDGSDGEDTYRFGGLEELDSIETPALETPPSSPDLTPASTPPTSPIEPGTTSFRAEESSPALCLHTDPAKTSCWDEDKTCTRAFLTLPEQPPAELAVPFAGLALGPTHRRALVTERDKLQWCFEPLEKRYKLVTMTEQNPDEWRRRWQDLAHRHKGTPSQTMSRLWKPKPRRDNANSGETRRRSDSLLTAHHGRMTRARAGSTNWTAIRRSSVSGGQKR